MTIKRMCIVSTVSVLSAHVVYSNTEEHVLRRRRSRHSSPPHLLFASPLFSFAALRPYSIHPNSCGLRNRSSRLRFLSASWVSTPAKRVRDATTLKPAEGSRNNYLPLNTAANHLSSLPLGSSFFCGSVLLFIPYDFPFHRETRVSLFNPNRTHDSTPAFYSIFTPLFLSSAKSQRSLINGNLAIRSSQCLCLFVYFLSYRSSRVSTISQSE